VGKAHAEDRQHAVCRRDAPRTLAATVEPFDIAREDAGPGDRIRPMFVSADDAAQRTHDAVPFPAGQGSGQTRSLDVYFLRGKRLAKSSAISFMVTNFTPGCLIIWA